MTKKRKAERTGEHLIWISRQSRELLDREAERLKQETGGTFSGSALADRWISERPALVAELAALKEEIAKLREAM